MPLWFPMTAPVFTAMIEAATAAPSPDNNQPWRFQAENNRLLVFLDPARSLPSDEQSMFDLTAIGAAVENAVIAAAEHQSAAEVTWLGMSEDAKDPLVEIKLRPGGTPNPLFSAIPHRCTCRKPYSRQPLDQRQFDSLNKSVEPFPDAQLNWIAAPGEKSRFGSLIAQTDSLRFRTRPFHEELFRQLRFTPQEAESTRDGLDVRTLELPPGVATLLRMLRSWKRMSAVHALKLTPLLTMPSKTAVKNSAAIAVVSVPTASPETFLVGGRAIERLWLTAAKEGLSMHPLGSLPIFLLQSNPKPEFRQAIDNARQGIAELLPATSERAIQLAFRIGISPPPSQRSLRL